MENCVRSQGAYFEGHWDIIALCTMSLVSYISFNKCLYFSQHMAGYFLDRPAIVCKVFICFQSDIYIKTCYSVSHFSFFTIAHQKWIKCFWHILSLRYTFICPGSRSGIISVCLTSRNVFQRGCPIFYSDQHCVIAAADANQQFPSCLFSFSHSERYVATSLCLDLYIPNN